MNLIKKGVINLEINKFFFQKNFKIHNRAWDMSKFWARVNLFDKKFDLIRAFASKQTKILRRSKQTCEEVNFCYELKNYLS